VCRYFALRYNSGQWQSISGKCHVISQCSGVWSFCIHPSFFPSNVIGYRVLFFHFYARKQLLLSARLSHRNSVRLSVRLSVRPSVTWVDQAKTVQARITQFLLSAARKTLVSGTVKLFHKFEGDHPERGR